MPLETTCTGCGRLLRVADEHAGRHARCPICNAITLIAPQAALTAAIPHASEGGQEAAVWHMKTPEGLVYGPVTHAELQRWIDEGRVTADCELRQSEDIWQTADTLFPLPAGPAPGEPHATTSAPAAPSYMRYQSPHRGVMILVLGIMGWVSGCPIFSVAAWTMGTADLRQMRLERMDPSGTSITQAGRILGMVYTLIWFGVLVLAALIFAWFVALH